MELTIAKRDSERKLEAKRARRKGEIPAILYCQGKKGENVLVNANEFKKFIRKMPSGNLPTTVFVLKDGGREIKAILKDVQYHVTSYEPIHLDFEELLPDVEISINVPIKCIGEAECAGVKLGGSLKQVMRNMRVRCLPKNIPGSFELDVKDLNIGQVRRLSDIVLPEGVTSLLDMKSVAVVISKQK